MTKVEFNWQKQQILVLCHLLGELGVTYKVHLWLVGKRVVYFLNVCISNDISIIISAVITTSRLLARFLQ